MQIITRGYEEIAKVINPKDGALDYVARAKAKTIMKLGFRKEHSVPPVYRIENIIFKIKRESGKLSVTALARKIREEMLK